MVVWMGDEPDARAWVNADQAAGEFRVRYAELFAAENALRGLRVTLAGHTNRDGVLFGARTWVITARTLRWPSGP
jgi:hypothetical protein